MNINQEIPYEIQKIQILCQKIVGQDEEDQSKEIKKILFQINLDEIIILKYLSYIMKITPQNVENIRKKSENFEILRDACEFYEELIEYSEIKQQNFINILVLNHLLTNLTISNVSLYYIYSNLFIVDMDLPSFYQIILTHCYGRPNSIYELSLFVKEFNEIQGNGKLIKETIFKFPKPFRSEWEIQTFEYFLKYFNIIENQLNTIQKIILKKKSSTNLFEQVKSREVFDPIYKCILIDDVDHFRDFHSSSCFDIEGCVKNSLKTNNYWPFGNRNKVNYIDLAAFFGSVKIFKLLILNHAEITNNLINYAIASGNLEIIHICIQNQCMITKQSFESAIRYYRQEILIWLIEHNRSIFEDHIGSLLEHAILYSNAKAFTILFENGCNLTLLNPNSFSLFEKEWIKYFLADKSLNDFMINKLTSSKIVEYDNYHYRFYDRDYVTPICSYFNPDICFPLKHYFQATNDLDKYLNDEKLILEPFPNKLISRYIRLSLYDLSWNDFYISNMFSIPYLLFMVDKGIVSFNKNVEIMCKCALKHEDIDFLYEITKYDETVPHIIFDYLLKIYKLELVRNGISKQLKKFFFDKCLNDIESNRSFQTELLIQACFFGNYFSFKQLIHRNFIDINTKQYKQGRSPLVLAAESNFISIVDYLLHDERIDVNLFDDEQKTSFYYACQNNNIEIVDLLLQNEKVDINIADIEGKTPFYVACENGFHKIVKRILQRSEANLNTLTKFGSPFGLAVENWHYKVVQILIESGKINYQNEGEESPLHRACLRGSKKMVELLFSIDSEKINKNEVDDIFFLFFFSY